MADDDGMTRQSGDGGLDALVVDRSWGLFVEMVEEYAVFCLDETGAVRTWNHGAARIKGYTEQEILGQHFSVFYPAEDRAAGIPDQELVQATATGHWSGEGWRVRKDGAQFWANVVITAVFDSQGALQGFVKITRDETERKLAEEDRRRLDLVLERERIAADLSDSTVRGIISATLAVHSALARQPEPQVAERLREALLTLDDTLKQMRSTVTGLVTEADDPDPT